MERQVEVNQVRSRMEGKVQYSAVPETEVK